MRAHAQSRVQACTRTHTYACTVQTCARLDTCAHTLGCCRHVGRPLAACLLSLRPPSWPSQATGARPSRASVGHSAPSLSCPPCSLSPARWAPASSDHCALCRPLPRPEPLQSGARCAGPALPSASQGPGSAAGRGVSCEGLQMKESPPGGSG